MRIEERYMVFFKKCARAIVGFPNRSEGNMTMLETDIKTVQATLDKKKRRFGTQFLTAGYLDSS